jgi:peptide-methionine (R)-S-oxide reductase
MTQAGNVFKEVRIKRVTFLKGLGLFFVTLLFSPLRPSQVNAIESGKPYEVIKTDEEWRKTLSPEQYRILRQEGTEAPFENRYHDFKGKGTYHCAGCDQLLFSWREKYDSQTGWPSFWQPAFSDAIGTKKDFKLGYPRTEVHCSRCGGHLGHLFNDGPAPTYLRYCINSDALIFIPAK